MPPVSKSKPPSLSPSPRPALASTTPILGAVLDHAARLERASQQLRLQLSWPSNLPFQLANVRAATLVLITPLAPVAARLRLEQSRILEIVSRTWGKPLSKLLVRTVPALATKAHPLPSPLSPAAAQHLRAAAAAADPDTQELLRRLASLAEPPGPGPGRAS
ncbi:MAG: hypothetical protein AB7V26_06840 [Lysobacterales bacterium]